MSSARIAAALTRVLADQAQIGRAGGAVDQRDAIQQEAGRERANQEVLERGLRRRAAHRSNPAST